MAAIILKMSLSQESRFCDSVIFIVMVAISDD